MRSFDSRSVGALECRAWETYYRRKWAAFLIASDWSVRGAAALRAEAMDVSDRWVEAGCDPEDGMLAEERALLIRSYAALLAAVHRP
jgi:hypothetical protein